MAAGGHPVKRFPLRQQKLKAEVDNVSPESIARLENEQARLRQQLDQKNAELAVELKDRENQVSAVQQTVEPQKHEIAGLRQQLNEWQNTLAIDRELSRLALAQCMAAYS